MHFPEDFFRWLVIFSVRAQQQKKPLFVGTLLNREKIGKALTRIALAVALSIMPVSLSSADQPREHNFNIPQQSVQTALTSLANQANVYLLFPYDQVIAVNANAVQGTYSVQQALNMLLHNTGLSGDLTEGGVLAISRAGANASATENHGKGKSMNITNSSKRKTVLAGLVGLFAAGGMTQAVAQGGEAATGQSAIDEIIVTANKREQALQDVPISIVALTGEQLENAGIKNLNDLSYLVPNLSVWEIGPGYQTITLRGVGNIRGTSSLIGMYLDEAPVSNIPLKQLDLQATDLARVEVLRGPQGTLYGQGSVGGTIRFITNDPSFDALGGSVGMSLYESRKGGFSEELTGVLNVPVIDDVLAVRLAATYKNTAGWIDHPATGKSDINDSELSNLRLKTLWQASENLTIKGTAIRHRNDAGASNIINLGDPSESLFQGAVDPASPQGIIDNYEVYNITADYDFGFASLTSASSYVELEKSEINGAQFAIFSFAPAALAELRSIEALDDSQVFSQEIRLSNNAGNSSFDWTLGVFYSDLEYRDQLIGGFEIVVPGVFSLSFPPADDRYTSESIAYFGDISYSITDRLIIGVGGRHFEDKRTLQGTSGFISKDTFDNFSAKGYVSFELTDDANIYASVSEGFRSGGFNNEAFILDGGPSSYDPESILSYEIGSKSTLLNKKLTTDMALFYSEYTDLQTQDFDPVAAAFGFVNVGEAVIKGIEFSLQWAATSQFTLGASGNITDAEVTEAGASTPQIKGDPLDFVPEYSYSLNADYQFAWSETASGFVGVYYNRQGKNSLVARTSNLAQPVVHSESIGFLNAQIGAQWESFSIELFAHNILDEDRVTVAANSRQAPQNRPRSIGLKFGLDF